MPPVLAPPAIAGPLALDHLAIFTVSGLDATAFLQAQLTGDIEGLASGQSRLTGYCSAKGRLLAIFVVVRTGADYLVVVPRELAAALVKRLSMFVLRSRVRIEDGSQAFRVTGHAHAAGSALPAPALASPYMSVFHDGATLVRVPDSCDLTRWLVIRGAPAIVAANDARADGQDEAAERARLSEGALWRWLDIRAGLPSVAASTQERFVPQMVNLEVLGGVDFKKGCYPGQEVVARSQYLGRIKRRMSGLSHATASVVPTPGTDILHKGEVCGSVVAAAPAPAGGVDLLAELPAAGAGMDLTLAGVEGELSGWSLPYEIPETEVFVRPRL